MMIMMLLVIVLLCYARRGVVSFLPVCYIVAVLVMVVVCYQDTVEGIRLEQSSSGTYLSLQRLTGFLRELVVHNLTNVSVRYFTIYSCCGPLRQVF